MALGPQPALHRVGFPVSFGRLLRTLTAAPRGWLLATRAALAHEPWTTGDTGLVGRAASGDHDAFEALIAPRAARLMATARKILRDPDAADDAAQRTLVLAWRTLPRLRDHARFDAWLSKLLVNECYGEARRQARAARRVRTLPTEPSVDDGSEARATRALLEEGFRALTPEHRAVVVLRHYADLPLAEVAAICGIPPGTARSRLHYALGSLRAALEAADRPVIEEIDR